MNKLPLGSIIVERGAAHEPAMDDVVHKARDFAAAFGAAALETLGLVRLPRFDTT